MVGVTGVGGSSCVGIGVLVRSFVFDFGPDAFLRVAVTCIFVCEAFGIFIGLSSGMSGGISRFCSAVLGFAGGFCADRLGGAGAGRLGGGGTFLALVWFGCFRVGGVLLRAGGTAEVVCVAVLRAFSGLPEPVLGRGFGAGRVSFVGVVWPDALVGAFGGGSLGSVRPVAVAGAGGFADGGSSGGVGFCAL